MKLIDNFINMLLNLPPSLLDQWGFWIILAASTIEATPLLGFFVPGQLIVVLAGFLSREGLLNLWAVLIAATIGAILGDWIGYQLGKSYGYSFLKKYGKYFLLNKEYYEKTQKLLKEHLGKALIIGRFTQFTRQISPVIAGSIKVPFYKFLFYDIIGGVLWSCSFVFIGFIFGESYNIASKYFSRFMFWAIIIGLLLIISYNFINKRRKIFGRYHLYTLILCLLSLILFTKLLIDVTESQANLQLDQWIHENIVLLWNPTLTPLMIFITTLMSTTVVVTLSLILFLVLVYKRKWFNSILLVCSLLGGLAAESVVKSFVHRPRPQNSLIAVSGFSFPSAHAAISIIFFSLIIYSFKDDIRKMTLKYLFIAINIIFFLLIGFSRIYLNVHWFSDVMAGFSLGLFWLTLMILILKYAASLIKLLQNPPFSIKKQKKKP